MKKYLAVLLLGITLIACSTGGQEKALEYNNFIVLHVDTAMYEMEVCYSIFFSNPEWALEAVDDVKSIISAKRKLIEEYTPIKGHEGMKTAAIELLNHYEKVMDDEYMQVVQILDTAEILEGTTKELAMEILDSAYDVELGLEERFSTEQQKLADKYGFETEEVKKELPF